MADRLKQLYSRQDFMDPQSGMRPASKAKRYTANIADLYNQIYNKVDPGYAAEIQRDDEVLANLYRQATGDAGNLNLRTSAEERAKEKAQREGEAIDLGKRQDTAQVQMLTNMFPGETAKVQKENPDLFGDDLIEAVKLEADKNYRSATLKNARDIAASRPSPKEDITYQQKKEIDAFYKQKPVDSNKQLGLFDQASSILDRGFSTGPFVGSPAAMGARKLFDRDAQDLDNVLAAMGLEEIAAFASRAGARAVDSDGERKYLLKALPSASMDEDVLRKKILIGKSLTLQHLINQESQKQYLSEKGNLTGWETPLKDQVTLYNPTTSEIIFQDKGTEPPQGFIRFQELTGSKDINVTSGGASRNSGISDEERSADMKRMEELRRKAGR